ncbi:MAG: DUF3667 domain-containing protein [Flavobacteriaceae bacterium]|nr:DUF3667 domain-containing protein [Flavobacteriaceae bacterium]
MNCKNCNAKINQNYCPNCGQPTKLKRINGQYILSEIGSVLNFDKGILFTIKELLLRPGQSIRNFVLDDRNRLVKPVIFIIVTSLIYSLINHFFHIEEGYMKFEETKQSTTGHIFIWVQDHYGYANIIMGIFIVLWIKLFFRKYNYNFFEILILLCFIMGIGMLIFSIFAIFKVLTHIDLMQIASIVSVLYSAWAIGQFFDKSKFSNYVKAFFSYLLGFLTFTFTVILIGTLIDLVIK